ncbi:unnamed protein product [Ixodes pacificus]
MASGEYVDQTPYLSAVFTTHIGNLDGVQCMLQKLRGSTPSARAEQLRTRLRLTVNNTPYNKRVCLFLFLCMQT